MAEELNTSEEAVNTASPKDFSSINTTGVTTDLGEYSAKPASLNIYKNVVGNPITGTNPKTKLSDINTAAVSPKDEAKLFDINVQSSKSDYVKMRPYTYNGDVDGANFERYYSTDQFKTLGFSPFRDNEALYNSKMTFGDQFVRAASQWDNLALTGFKSGIKAWGTLFTDPLAPDIESAREMQKAMAIGNSSSGGIGGFVTNTFLNSAYTIGIAADFLAEEVALGAVTAFTGGLAGEVTLPGMAAKAGMATRKLMGFGEAVAGAEKAAAAGRLAKEAETVKKATDNIKGIRSFNDARNFYNSIKAGELGAKQIAMGTLRTLNPFENTLQALEKTDYATDLIKTTKTFGAFADDIISIKTAVSEAKLEGGMVKIDANKALIDEYKRTHFGQEPDEKELAKIEALSGEEARRTAFWNLPAIMTSNKLLYATMLAPIRKMVGRGSSVKLLDDIIASKPLKATTTEGFAKLGEGFGSKARAAAKSLAQPKIYGQVGMNYLKANFAEGIQENLQEAISKGAINHALAVFKDPKMGAYHGYMGHFMEGMKDQFSAEGAETFAGGFLMGMFAQPIMAVPAWSFTKLSKLAGDKSKIEEAKRKRDETIDRQVKILNELSKDNLKHFFPEIHNVIRNGTLSDDLYTAIKEGKHKEAKDAQEEIEYNHIMTALETSKFDLFVDQLEDYKNLSPEEAAEAFAKYGVAKEDVGKALKAMDGVIARAKKIKETYEEVATNYPNPFNPNQYEHGSDAYLAAVNSSIAWRKAQQNLVFATNTFQHYGQRLEKMYNSFSKLSSNIAKEDSQSLMNVLSLPSLEKELKLLRDEVKVLGNVPEQADVKRDKEKRIEILEQFQEELLAAEKTTDPIEKEKIHENAKKVFAKYAKYLSKKNNTIVFDKDMDEAFSLLKDGLQIQKDRQGLAESINVLSSPKGFMNLQYRLQQAITEHDKEKAEQAKKMFDLLVKLQEKNDALNEITKETGLTLSAEYIAEYQKALDKGETPILPTNFIDPSRNEQVTQGVDFDKALELWEMHLNIVTVKAELEKQKKKDEKLQTLKSFDSAKYEEYPDELKAKLEEKYNALIKAGDISDEMTIEEFSTQFPAGKNIVDDFKKQLEKEILNEKTAEFQEYLNLTLKELENKHKELLEKYKTEPSVLNELNKVKQALNYKIRLSIKMTPEQENALALVKALSKRTVNKDKVDNNYIINGEKKDTRVTKLIDQILEENYPDYSKFAVFEKSAAPILDAYIKAQEDDTVKANAKNREAYVDSIFEFIKKDLADNKDNEAKQKAQELFNKQFNGRKLKLFKEELKSNTSNDNFKKLFEKYIYEETTIRGNVVDKLVRDYFEGVELIKPSNMSETAFNNLRTKLIEFDQQLAEQNEVVVASGLVLSGVTTNEVNGKPQTIAGEMDLLVVTPGGEYKIYDMKTSSKWEYFGNKSDKSAKKEKYSLQLSLYKNLLENTTGIKVTNLELIAFKTKEDLDGNITSLTEEPRASKTKINYNEFKEIVNKYIPSKLEVAAPVPTGTETTTDLKAKKADIEERRQEDLKNLNKTTLFNGSDRQFVEVKPSGPVQIEDIEGKDEILISKKQSDGTVKVGRAKRKENGLWTWIIAVVSDTGKAMGSEGFTDSELFENLASNRIRKAEAIAYRDYDAELAALEGTVSDKKADIESFETAKGSVYTVLPDGRTQRFKTATGEQNEPNDLIVFVKFKNVQQEQDFLSAQNRQDGKKLYVVDSAGNVYDTNEQVKGKDVKLAIVKDGKVIETVETSLEPKIGYNTFDQRRYEEKGEKYRSTHLGNKVTKINTRYDAELKALKGKPVGEFNELSIEKKFKTIVDELKPGEQLSGVFQKGVYPNAADESSYHVVLDDGRVVRVTQFFKDNKLPIGEKVTIQKIKKAVGDKPSTDVIEVLYNGNVLTYIRESTPKNEKAKVEVPESKQATIETLNQNININSLQVAKDRNYEVMYESVDNPEKNGRYIIKEIKENSVSLSGLSGDISVKTENIPNEIKSIIDIQGIQNSKEDIDTAVQNQSAIKNVNITYTEKSEDELKKDIQDNIC